VKAYFLWWGCLIIKHIYITIKGHSNNNTCTSCRQIFNNSNTQHTDRHTVSKFTYLSL